MYAQLKRLALGQSHTQTPNGQYSFIAVLCNENCWLEHLFVFPFAWFYDKLDSLIFILNIWKNYQKMINEMSFSMITRRIKKSKNWKLFSDSMSQNTHFLYAVVVRHNWPNLRRCCALCGTQCVLYTQTMVCSRHTYTSKFASCKLAVRSKSMVSQSLGRET